MNDSSNVILHTIYTVNATILTIFLRKCNYLQSPSNIINLMYTYICILLYVCLLMLKLVITMQSKYCKRF